MTDNAIKEPLTDSESATFNALTSGKYGNFLLIRSVFNGEPVAVIAASNPQDDGSIAVTPLAVLVTDQIMSGLEDPTDGE